MRNAVPDPEAWVAHVYAAIVGPLALYCQSTQTAEDVAQEALIRLWQRRAEVDDPTAWAFRCAFNLAASSFRRRAAERRALRRSRELLTEVESPMPDVERDIDLQRALAALSNRQRQAVLLHYLADFDHARVAAVMNCSVGTVKAHLARGLAALRSSGLVSNTAALDSLEKPI